MSREAEGLGTDRNPIDAILVFSDSSNWYLDLQLMYDLLTSGKSHSVMPMNSMSSLRVLGFASASKRRACRQS